MRLGFKVFDESIFFTELYETLRGLPRIKQVSVKYAEGKSCIEITRRGQFGMIVSPREVINFIQESFLDDIDDVKFRECALYVRYTVHNMGIYFRNTARLTMAELKNTQGRYREKPVRTAKVEWLTPSPKSLWGLPKLND